MKFMNILLIVGALSLNAQVLNVAKDWNLFGAVVKINDLTPLDNECVNSVFVYKNNNWLSYSKGEIQSIDKGLGFWVYASKACTITLSNPVSSANTSGVTYDPNNPDHKLKVKNK